MTRTTAIAIGSTLLINSADDGRRTRQILADAQADGRLPAEAVAVRLPRRAYVSTTGRIYRDADAYRAGSRPIC